MDKSAIWVSPEATATTLPSEVTAAWLYPSLRVPQREVFLVMPDPKLDSPMRSPDRPGETASQAQTGSAQDPSSSRASARRAAFERSRARAVGAQGVSLAGAGDITASIARLNQTSLAHIAEMATGRIGAIGVGGLLFQEDPSVNPPPTLSEEERSLRDIVLSTDASHWDLPAEEDPRLPATMPDTKIVCVLEWKATGNPEKTSLYDWTLIAEGTRPHTYYDAKRASTGTARYSGAIPGALPWKIHGRAGYHWAAWDTPNPFFPGQPSDEAPEGVFDELNLPDGLQLTGKLIVVTPHRTFDVTVGIRLGILARVFAVGNANASIGALLIGSPGNEVGEDGAKQNTLASFMIPDEDVTIPAAALTRGRLINQRNIPQVAKVMGDKTKPGAIQSDPRAGPRHIDPAWDVTIRYQPGVPTPAFKMNFRNLTALVPAGGMGNHASGSLYVEAYMSVIHAQPLF